MIAGRRLPKFLVNILDTFAKNVENTLLIFKIYRTVTEYTHHRVPGKDIILYSYKSIYLETYRGQALRLRLIRNIPKYNLYC